MQKQYGDRLTALEAKLNATEPAPQQRLRPLRKRRRNQAASRRRPRRFRPAPKAPEGRPERCRCTAAAASSKVFNPDIAVIGDFLGAARTQHGEPAPALAMHESEASFQAVVDPYARADFFLSFGEEGVELEEGFITFPAVPGGLLVRVGKMRAAFGKVNTLHNHVLPWTDRPLVTNNLVGGEEGIDDAGISVARLIPNPWFFLEATGQVFRGDSGDLFHSSKRGDLSYVGHLRGYHDITENTNIDLGASYSHGHNASGVFGDVDLGRFTTQLYGIDATVRWRPLQRSIYRLVRRPLGADLEPARAARHDNRTRSAITCPATISSRAAGSRAPATTVRRTPTTSALRDSGPVAAADLLAERVQPGARPVPADEVRRRRSGERVSVPVPVFDRRARCASVLRQCEARLRVVMKLHMTVMTSRLLVVSRCRSSRRSRRRRAS